MCECVKGVHHGNLSLGYTVIPMPLPKMTGRRQGCSFRQATSCSSSTAVGKPQIRHDKRDFLAGGVDNIGSEEANLRLKWSR